MADGCISRDVTFVTGFNPVDGGLLRELDAFEGGFDGAEIVLVLLVASQAMATVDEEAFLRGLFSERITPPFSILIDTLLMGFCFGGRCVEMTAAAIASAATKIPICIIMLINRLVTALLDCCRGEFNIFYQFNYIIYFINLCVS